MSDVPSPPLLSVILPVYNAMPWLPIALRDMLQQQLPDERALELLVAFDGGNDGSLPFLLALIAELGGTRASDEVFEVPLGAPVFNPALVQPLRASEASDHPTFSETVPDATLNVAEVASACRPEHRLRVLRYSDGANRGQGSAMSLAMAHSQASLYVAQMESDDVRGSATAFARMITALEAQPDWDGVSCNVELVGADRPGMEGYVAWQNSLATPQAMAAGRFIEIPALHQTALFRREAVEAVLAPTKGNYRDGPYRGGQDGGCSAVQSVAAAALDVPVDLWWWLAFFHAGKRCGKLGGQPLFGWRQVRPRPLYVCYYDGGRSWAPAWMYYPCDPAYLTASSTALSPPALSPPALSPPCRLPGLLPRLLLDTSSLSPTS